MPASTLTLDSVMEVSLPLHGLLGHDLKQVVGVGDDLCAQSKVKSQRALCLSREARGRVSGALPCSR